jgi:RNA polymerase sigma-70 factor, ECF subfamily
MDSPLLMARLSVSETQDRRARFEILYAQNYGRVLGYVLRRAPAAVAADVVADVFLVAWRRLDRVPEEPLPWLLGVAHKTLANERRGGRRRSALVEALTKESAGPGNSRTPAEEHLRAVTAAVDHLPERDRDLLRLIAWDGLTTREAATVLGISHSACRVRLHRARRRLTQELAPDDPAESTIGIGVARLDAREET